MDSASLFSKHKYISLETYRKSGQGVPTPVWFIESGNRLYVHTSASSGKIKRLRNNPRVRVAICDVRGKLKGGWVEGEARLVTGEEMGQALAMLKRKYGIPWRVLEWVYRKRKWEQAVIAVRIV
jgi:PPOX class probable F420-dependent enzyme